MVKKTLGIEIGNKRIKIAVGSAYEIDELIVEDIPDNLVHDGVIVSWDAMGEFIKEIIKEHKIPYKRVSVVLPEQLAYVRRFTMPAMSVEQLKVNLPYEFHDYITEDKDEYVYDYEVLKIKKDSNDNISAMDIMGVATLKDTVERYSTMFRRVGLKLVKVCPESYIYKRLIKDYDLLKSRVHCEDYAILDLGYQSCKLHFFSKGEYEITRYMEPGCKEIDTYIGEKFGIDTHLAQIYKEKNKDNVLHDSGCTDIYGRIAVEAMRVINFYNYNHPDNNLETLFYCGGPSLIKPLIESIGSSVGMNMVSIKEFFTGKSLESVDALIGSEAIGILFEQEVL